MFIRRIWTCNLIVAVVVILKWKKVFEECLVEYVGLSGSKAGVINSLFLAIVASSRLPESKFEEIVIFVESTSKIKSLCLIYIY